MQIEIGEMCFLRKLSAARSPLRTSLKDCRGNNAGEKRAGDDENHQQVFQRGLPPGNLNRMPGAIDAMNEGMKKAQANTRER